MNDYAISKWVNEMQILNSAAMFGTETVRVRLFNVYGVGEHYTPYRGWIPKFIYKAMRMSLTLFTWVTNVHLNMLRISAEHSLT